jgi:hypothetical protein
MFCQSQVTRTHCIVICKQNEAFLQAGFIVFAMIPNCEGVSSIVTQNMKWTKDGEFSAVTDESSHLVWHSELYRHVNQSCSLPAFLRTLV